MERRIVVTSKIARIVIFCLPLWPTLVVGEVVDVKSQVQKSGASEQDFKSLFSEALSKLAPGACITQRCDKKGRRHVNDEEAKKIAHCIVTSNTQEAAQQFPESSKYIRGGQSGLYFKCTINEGFTCTDNFFSAANTVHSLTPPMLVISPQDFIVKGFGSSSRSALISSDVVGPFAAKAEEHGAIYYDGLKSVRMRCSGACFDVRPSRENEVTREESKLGPDSKCNTAAFPSA